MDPAVHGAVQEPLKIYVGNFSKNNGITTFFINIGYIATKIKYGDFVTISAKIIFIISSTEPCSPPFSIFHNICIIIRNSIIDRSNLDIPVYALFAADEKSFVTPETLSSTALGLTFFIASVVVVAAVNPLFARYV